jgi:integrase
MRSHDHRGRVYRRCACRTTDGKQIGARCPRLASSARHGTWTFAVDMPSLTGKRTTLRRGGYPTRTAATAALTHVLDCERAGVWLDDTQTVADFLATWLAEKSRTLKPTTTAVYHDYIVKDLVPAFGAIRLEKLNHLHVARFIDDQLAASRGPTTVRRLVATLSSALGDAVRQRRLRHNPARYAPLPRPSKPNLPCWSPTDAVTFLRYCAAVDDPLADLFEILIGTGLRKGEALALHWADVHLDQAVLFVRYTLSNIRNTTPVMTAPKTKSSHAWVGLSGRVVAAFERQAGRQVELGVTSHLVFSQLSGAPLRPESVLHHFHLLCTQAGVPRIRVHDLRHLAATLMISSQVPLTMASKTLRHSKLSITVDTYGHLVPYAAQQAVDAIADALAAAELSRTDLETQES